MHIIFYFSSFLKLVYRRPSCYLLYWSVVLTSTYEPRLACIQLGSCEEYPKPLGAFCCFLLRQPPSLELNSRTFLTKITPVFEFHPAGHTSSSVLPIIDHQCWSRRPNQPPHLASPGIIHKTLYGVHPNPLHRRSIVSDHSVDVDRKSGLQVKQRGLGTTASKWAVSRGDDAGFWSPENVGRYVAGGSEESEESESPRA